MREGVISLVILFIFLALIIFIFSSIERDTENPTVNIGGNHTGNSLFIQDAAAYDAISGIATYNWTQLSGPGTITFGNPNEEDTTISASDDGIYVIRLTVTDNAGNFASSDATIYYFGGINSAGNDGITTTPKNRTTSPKNYVERKRLNEEFRWLSSLFELNEKNTQEITVRVDRKDNQLSIFSINGSIITNIYFDPKGAINFQIPIV